MEYIYDKFKHIRFIAPSACTVGNYTWQGNTYIGNAFVDKNKIQHGSVHRGDNSIYNTEWEILQTQSKYLDNKKTSLGKVYYENESDLKNYYSSWGVGASNTLDSLYDSTYTAPLKVYQYDSDKITVNTTTPDFPVVQNYNFPNASSMSNYNTYKGNLLSSISGCASFTMYEYVQQQLLQFDTTDSIEGWYQNIDNRTKVHIANRNRFYPIKINPILTSASAITPVTYNGNVNMDYSTSIWGAGIPSGPEIKNRNSPLHTELSSVGCTVLMFTKGNYARLKRAMKLDGVKLTAENIFTYAQPAKHATGYNPTNSYYSTFLRRKGYVNPSGDMVFCKNDNVLLSEESTQSYDDRITHKDMKNRQWHCFLQTSLSKIPESVEELVTGIGLVDGRYVDQNYIYALHDTNDVRWLIKDTLATDIDVTNAYIKRSKFNSLFWSINYYPAVGWNDNRTTATNPSLVNGATNKNDVSLFYDVGINHPNFSINYIAYENNFPDDLDIGYNPVTIPWSFNNDRWYSNAYTQTSLVFRNFYKGMLSGYVINQDANNPAAYRNSKYYYDNSNLQLSMAKFFDSFKLKHSSYVYKDSPGSNTNFATSLDMRSDTKYYSPLVIESYTMPVTWSVYYDSPAKSVFRYGDYKDFVVDPQLTWYNDQGYGKEGISNAHPDSTVSHSNVYYSPVVMCMVFDESEITDVYTDAKALYNNLDNLSLDMVEFYFSSNTKVAYFDDTTISPQDFLAFYKQTTEVSGYPISPIVNPVWSLAFLNAYDSDFDKSKHSIITNLATEWYNSWDLTFTAPYTINWGVNEYDDYSYTTFKIKTQETTWYKLQELQRNLRPELLPDSMYLNGIDNEATVEDLNININFNDIDLNTRYVKGM